jgi:hypothetical protein
MKVRTGSFLLLLELVGFAVQLGLAQSPSKMWIPIKLKDGFLVIANGSIGSLRNLTFLIDTGTSRTLIDSHIIEQLELTGMADKLTAFDREVDVKRVTLPDLHLGEIHAESPHVIATDFSGIAQRFGIEVDAVIGMDILRLGNFDIDYNAKRIWFSGREPMASMLPAESGNEPYLIVKVRIDDIPVTLMIDTGCDGLMLFANSMPNGLEGRYSASLTSTVFGEVPVTRIGSGELSTGRTPAYKVRFHIVETGNNRMGFDGILGVRALHASRIRFDFEQMAVSWR